MKCVDAHSDILNDITAKRTRGETDIFHNYHFERLKKGEIEGSIWVIWADANSENGFSYEERTKQIIKCANDEINSASDFRVVHNYEEMMKAREEGIFYVFLGVEGMAYIGDDIDRLNDYYDLGARYGILTWNESNTLASGVNSGVNTGLTPLGKEVVKRMEELHMIVDVSHLNEAGFWDIASIASKPFIASHSNCTALCGVPRNLTDEQLRAIRDCNGVVGLNAYAGFVSADPRKQTIEQLAEHAGHIIDITGIDHVMCGFDFCEFIEGDISGGSPIADKTNPNVTGLETAEYVQSLFDVFDSMGMSKADQEKIAYKNIHRIIRDVIG